MANNRLYIVDTKTKEYLCLAKDNGHKWITGNNDLYKDFINSRTNNNISLIIGNENDDNFHAEWIENGINYNETNKWM